MSKWKPAMALMATTMAMEAGAIAQAVPADPSELTREPRVVEAMKEAWLETIHSQMGDSEYGFSLNRAGGSYTLVAQPPSFPSGARGAEIRQVTVRVFNKARLSVGDLGKALREAEAIYSETGIAIRWEEGSIDDHESMALDFSANGALGGVCPQKKSGSLNLLLVRGPANSSGSPTLGLALPCAKFGSDALVFVDRCENSMQGRPASLGKVLGHAMAHEIGHVLLGTDAHSAGGLMKARWGRADWFAVAAGHLRIAPDDGEKMRSGLERESVAAAH
jgi:hypothetical protein